MNSLSLGWVDWGATGSMLSGWATLAGAAAVVYAAHKGSNTFKSWRRQKSEERRIDLAEQVLTLAYKSRRAIEDMRAPGILGVEMAELHDQLCEQGVVDDNTPVNHKAVLANAQAILSRSNSRKAVWDALLDTLPATKAIFGSEVEAQLEEFWKQRCRLIAAAHSYAGLIRWPRAHTEEASERQYKRQRDIENVIWAGAADDDVDAVVVKVDAAVASLESWLLPIIRSDTPFGTGPGSLARS